MIDLNPKHLETIQHILTVYIPECEVRAFGSRVKWTAKDYSDLDLAVIGSKPLSFRQLRQLAAAFEESYLPIRVDVVDWWSLPDGFRKVILEKYEVIQEAETIKGNKQSGKVSGKSDSTDRQLVIFEKLFDIPLRNGLTRPRAVRGSGVKMVNMGELFDYSRIGNIPMERVPLSEVEAEKYLLKKGDLLFARQSLVHSGAGKCSIFLGALEPITYEGHLIRARLNPSIADPAFYFYFFNSRSGRQIVESIIEQVAAAGIRGSDLAKLAVPYFPIQKQHQIAHILGTLDDKIELNRQMNETLESMAQAIFKSWFVDFDPVQAKMEGSKPYLPLDIWELFPDRLVDSVLGKIPEGWSIGTLGDLSHKPQYGYTASAKDEVVGPKFLRITDINKQAWVDWNSVPYCEITDKDLDKYRLHKGDVLIARMADPGHGVMIEENQEAVFASYLIRFRPILDQYARFLQYWIRSNSYWELVKGRETGTTRASLNAKVLSGFPLIIPPIDTVETFSNQVSDLRARVVANASEIQLLTTLRDTLLPKLLSGGIRVDDVDKRLGVKDGGTS